MHNCVPVHFLLATWQLAAEIRRLRHYESQRYPHSLHTVRFSARIHTGKVGSGNCTKI
jgi:hypothetical protein